MEPTDFDYGERSTARGPQQVTSGEFSETLDDVAARHRGAERFGT